MDRKIRVAITHGDTNGIGYEIILKAFADSGMLEMCTPIIYGSPKIATYHRNTLQLETPLSIISKAEDAHPDKLNMLAAFNDVDKTFKNTYDKVYDQWMKDSIAKNKPITPEVVIGKSPLAVTDIAFGNFDAKGGVISDYNKPLRKSAIKYIKAIVDVSAEDRGLFKLGMKIVNPDGKPMIATKGVEYCATANVEIKKANRVQQCEFDSYGSDDANFWKAGEYNVEIYDFEKGIQLYKTTFNIL